ncbi:TonB-dependent receptor plug domain-containing protein [Aestuariivivens insulae]|uniref:TonB-dependent receptor plug domain-containing protein n=1 Tax=Aestuariivivens insulae TaxID=1621988 RepID=UPI001F5A5DEC|nr:TonB-dependent receptor plug domain-containing protein [Aestuariivivens insulae]
MRTYILLLIFGLFVGESVNSQESNIKDIELSGVVIDYNKKPIKGAKIFIDSLKTKVKTNKDGFYKITVSLNNKLVTVFSPDHGIIDIDYSGQKIINFVFPESIAPLTKRQFYELGYGMSPYTNNEPDYSSYSDIFQLLKSKFPNLQVIGESVRMRNSGISIKEGLPAPIFIVNGSQVSNITSISPSDIKSIKVEKSNTSLYGTRGSGGVIKIKLK